MDWMMTLAVLAGGWMLLSVLSSERITRYKQMSDAVAAAKAASDAGAMEQAARPGNSNH